MTDSYVLVVDDDPGIRILVARLLEDEGYATRSAEDGRMALAIAEEAMPSLVLLDMRMPVMDGWEFARQLQSSVGYVPVIVMSAAREAKLWADEIKADGYVSKPFDLDDLVGAVRGVLPPREPSGGQLIRE